MSQLIGTAPSTLDLSLKFAYNGKYQNFLLVKTFRKPKKTHPPTISFMRMSYTYGILTTQSSFVMVVQDWMTVRNVRREDTQAYDPQ